MKSHVPALILAKQLLERGDEEGARKIIMTERRRPWCEPEAHFQWGLLCDELAAFQQARQSYEEALKRSPKNSNYLYHLGRLHADAGLFEKAVRYLTQALQYDPAHADGKMLLARIYENSGLEGSARALTPKRENGCSSVRYFKQPISIDDLDLYSRLFSGKEIGYMTQRLMPATGQAEWEFHNGPITTDVIKKHIHGDITLGGLPLRSDNTVKYAAIHIRPPQQLIFHYLKTISILIQIEESAQEQASKIIKKCSQQGISAYLENPGCWGRRIWLFFSQFSHFLLIKRFVEHVIELSPLPGSCLIMEPLLATQPIGIGWKERALLLPLGVDHRTGKRCLFINSDGTPYAEQLKQIRKIREINESYIRKFLKRKLNSCNLMVEPKKEPQVLRNLWINCPVLAELKYKAQAGRMLSGDEKLILFYTLGLSAKTRNYLHDLMDPCPDYHYQKTEKMLSQLKPHPISCLKIRKLIPDITSSVQCSCVFDLRGGRYPSPFLHLEPTTPLCVAEEIASPSSITKMAQQYILLSKKYNEISRDIERIEGALHDQFTKKKLEKMTIAGCTLRRIVKNEKDIIIIER
ncbi:MAG: CRISPR-associated primase-polymerase type A1 [bacterium]